MNVKRFFRSNYFLHADFGLTVSLTVTETQRYIVEWVKLRSVVDVFQINLSDH